MDIQSRFRSPPERVVSLVPSVTESLFDLDCGDRVVGITDYCVHPAEQLSGLPRLKGPKNPDFTALLSLKPDLVIVNQEENPPEAVEALEAAHIPVWVTFPKTVREAMAVLWDIAELFRNQAAFARIRTLEMALEWAESAGAGRTRWRYFCPIWQGRDQSNYPWWMTFNQETYCNDLLRVFGGENVFAKRERRYPLGADLGLEEPQPVEGGDLRYPRVTLEEIQAAAPQVILLPDEPFPFGQQEREELCTLLRGAPVVEQDAIILLDGSLITWHGTRLGRALQVLPEILF